MLLSCNPSGLHSQTPRPGAVEGLGSCRRRLIFHGHVITLDLTAWNKFVSCQMRANEVNAELGISCDRSVASHRKGFHNITIQHDIT